MEASNQAARIIAKFGGADSLASAIGRDPSTIYRWANPKAFTRGLIPSSAVFDILGAAAFHGIKLTAEDWFP